jgi:pimeloyl-ACP methyl ester carboxylesterase
VSRWSITTGAVAGFAGLLHLAARANVRRIKNNPDPYPLDVLSREPDGEEVMIERPDGTRIRAIAAGDGPPIVFAHGYGATLLEWNIIWNLLRNEYRLIAYDQRGHGRSTIGADDISSAAMAGDLGAVLEYFDVQDGVLIGHSMGGFLSLIFLLNHPDAARAHLSHAIIMGSFAGDVGRGAPQTRLQIPLIQSGIMERLTQTETYGWAFTASLAGARPAPAVVEMYRRLFVAQHHRPLVPILRAFLDENYYSRLGEITLPCTIVYGLSDKTTPALHSETIAQGIPSAQLVRVPAAGHLINWEAPERIADIIQMVAQPELAY